MLLHWLTWFQAKYKEKLSNLQTLSWPIRETADNFQQICLQEYKNRDSRIIEERSIKEILWYGMHKFTRSRIN